MPGFEDVEPSGGEIALRLAVQFVLTTVFEFLVLWPVLLLLRRPMDLTFPETPRFVGRMLVIAAVMAGLVLIPFVGWMLALLAVAALTVRYFDGGLLSGAYVALAMYGADKFLGYFMLAWLPRSAW